MNIKQRLKNYPTFYNFLRALHNIVNYFFAKIRRASRFFLPYRFRRYTKGAALGGDPFLKALVVNLGAIGVTSCVETGSYRGDTTLFFAKIFPDILKYSIEIKREYFRESAWRVRTFKNSNVIRGSSPGEIKKLIYGKKLGSSPLFFLDAHWYGYCPLKDELLEISKLDRAIIIIHDFQVINWGLKGYRHKNITLNFDYIKEILTGRNYRYLLPKYDLQNAYEIIAPAGYVLLFQNFNKEEWDRILRISVVKAFYAAGKI